MEPSPTDPSSSPAGVTVVITAYNYASVLPAAINSVLAQDHPLLETIVVDDGSTDNTREVVAGFGDRVRYINQPNAGLSAARNTGIKAARHAFVAFLDADDEWRPGMLSTLMKTFSRLPLTFGLVACSCQKVNESGTHWPKTKLSTRYAREIVVEDLILMNRFAADAVVARRNILEKSGLFDTGLTSSEDRDMWIRMADHSRIYFLPEVLVTVRIHPGSMSRNPARMKLNMGKVLRQARLRQNRRFRWSPFFWAKAQAFYHYQVAWMFADAGQPRAACGEMLRSLCCCPIFMQPGDLHENYLFRVRSLLYFSFCLLRRSA